jgi:hypothetical protein
MERVMIVFGRGVGEVIRARWSWWRTALRSYEDVRIGWREEEGLRTKPMSRFGRCSVVMMYI